MPGAVEGVACSGGAGAVEVLVQWVCRVEASAGNAWISKMELKEHEIATEGTCRVEW